MNPKIVPYTTEEFKDKLTAKGKDLEAKLAKAGGYWNG